MCVSVQNFVQIGQAVAEIAIYLFFEDGGSALFWICGANFGTTHKEYLDVFITVPNLVGIA